MLLVLAVEVQRMLDFLAEAFALGRLAVAVAAVLLFVDIAGSTALPFVSHAHLIAHAVRLTPVWNSSWLSRELISGTTSTERRSGCASRRGDFPILPAPPRPVENSPSAEWPWTPSRTMPPSV